MGYYIEKDVSEEWISEERDNLMQKMSKMRPGPAKEKIKDQLQQLKYAKKVTRIFVPVSGGQF